MTVEEKANEYVNSIEPRAHGCAHGRGLIDGFIAGYEEAMRWREPTEAIKEQIEQKARDKYPVNDFYGDFDGENKELRAAFLAGAEAMREIVNMWYDYCK